MKKRLLLSLGIFAAVQNLFAQDLSKSDYCNEPKTVLNITIDGKTYTFDAGDTLKIKGNFSDPSISVTEGSVKKFISNSVNFSYPKSLSFACNENLGVTTWSLNGDNIIVLYFEAIVELPVEDLISSIAQKFGATSSKVVENDLKLANRTFPGKKVLIEVAGQGIGLYFFELYSGKKGSAILALQATYDDEGNIPLDFTAAKKEIDNSLNVKWK